MQVLKAEGAAHSTYHFPKLLCYAKGPTRLPRSPLMLHLCASVWLQLFSTAYSSSFRALT